MSHFFTFDIHKVQRTYHHYLISDNDKDQHLSAAAAAENDIGTAAAAHANPSRRTTVPNDEHDDNSDESLSALAAGQGARRRRRRRRLLEQQPLSQSFKHKKQANAIIQCDNRHDVQEIKYKFGHVVHWMDGLHYTEQELEPYRFVGDAELDRILDTEELLGLEGVSKGRHDVSGRFFNTIQACAKVYHEEMAWQNEESTHKEKQKCCLTNNHLNKKQLAMFNFYRHYHDLIPEWVDWDQIQRGMDVFILYSPAAGQALFYLSLVPGFSIPKIAKVLQQTRYLVPPSTPQQVTNRLMDTGGFLASFLVGSAANQNPEWSSSTALRPGEKGWTMALQVRLLHAKVRRSILQNRRKEWDVNQYGVPINQEDMAATLLAFSVNVLVGIEFVAGRPLPLSAQRDYLALWRYVGWLLGVDSVVDKKQDLLQRVRNGGHDDGGTHDERSGGPNHVLFPLDPCGPKQCQFPTYGQNQNDNGYDPIVHAHASLESFILHLMHPDDTSKEIAHHLLRIGRQSSQHNLSKRTTTNTTTSSSYTATSTSPEENYFAFLYRSCMCRRYVGDELADALGLVHPNTHDGVKVMTANLLSWVVLMILRVYTVLTMKSQWFQRFAYTRHLHLLSKFEAMWRRNHGERMVQVEREVNGSVVMEETVAPNDQYHDQKNNLHGNKESFCPFGMVMPPSS